ncbi:YdaS family helix-turn-helix protein [Bradyrhizobium elkanii]|uniref:YdaS family helix-turn-helix protein n=1 Tax=Bradyrhizobium elkanii TaxID=29448 RepID=UPI000404A476|nr:YdaS family helix-turn-helix protein [Bradyrhizobium elkanii]
MPKRKANAVIEAIRTQRGLAAKLAKVCGISRSAVWKWQQVPAEHALAVATFLQLKRHEVRPDLYPANLPEERVGA